MCLRLLVLTFRVNVDNRDEASDGMNCMFEKNIDFHIRHGFHTFGVFKRKNSLALLSNDFEDFLERHMDSLGLSVVKEPKLLNGRTPDFLVESEDVKCYVEATARPDARDQILDGFDGYGHKPYTLFISALQSSEKAHLNRRREIAGEIVRWADDFLKDIYIDDTEDYSVRERFPAKSFEMDGYDWVVNSLVYFSASEMFEIEKMACGFDRRLPVGWPDVDRVRKIGAESRQKEDVRSLRHALREKAVRYLPIPDGIGDAPLVIAVNDYESDLVVDELLGTRGVRIYRGGLAPTLNEREDNGFWRRAAQSKRRHVKAVWHFERVRSDNPDFRAKLILNPDEGSARSILPKRLFSDPRTEVVWLG